jgi:hypothetical protein
MPNVVDQVQDLGLHRDVERGSRLVGDHHVGTVGERHRDHHPLPLAAGQLVRILVHAALGVRDAYLRQQLDRPRPGRLLRQLLV